MDSKANLVRDLEYNWYVLSPCKRWSGGHLILSCYRNPKLQSVSQAAATGRDKEDHGEYTRIPAKEDVIIETVTDTKKK